VDNQSGEFVHSISSELASLFLSEDSDLMEYCKKHNIRKIRIRCLSELSKVYTTVTSNFDEVQKYSWAHYFNADCTLSNRYLDSLNCGQVRKYLLERMIDLDELSYEKLDDYEGHTTKPTNFIRFFSNFEFIHIYF
jgi:hypothetical protein